MHYEMNFYGWFWLGFLAIAIIDAIPKSARK